MQSPSARRRVLRPLLSALLILALVAAFGPALGTFAQDRAEDEKQDAKPAKKSLTDKLGGAQRFRTHLATDKPIYRAGETVYVRGTVLDASSHRPFHAVANEKIQAFKKAQEAAKNDPAKLRKLRRPVQTHLSPFIEIKDPKGATLVAGTASAKDSVIGFKWQVPDGQAGGEYTIRVSFPWAGLAPVERKFDIRAYRAPRIKTQIQFLKDGYGPGDTVVATVTAKRAEGGIPEGAKVTAIARVDGKEVARVKTMVRETGVAEARFDLPQTITRGEGSLAFIIEDGGVVESASKTLPILLQTVDLKLYPEGGDLVAGVQNRVYFETRTPYGKPADIKGVIIEDNPQRDQATPPKQVAEFETTHEGRGVFAFIPQKGVKYKLQVLEPSSVTQVFDLPAISAGVIAMQFDQTIFNFEEAIRFKVSHSEGQGISLSAGTAMIRVRQREIVVAGKTLVYTAEGSQQVMLLPEHKAADSKEQLVLPETATGILTVTAYDAKGKPLAERLIYRAPKQRVNIEVLPNSAQYTPGGKVELTIKTTDQDGKPISAIAGLTVTDDAVLEMIEKREQAPSLPAMVLLEQEVKELADAHVYLDPDNPDAAKQLDLLLGTQGWRRFALVNLADFIREHGDDARRMLAMQRPVRREIEKAIKLAEADEERGGGGLVPLADPGAPVPKAAKNDAPDQADDKSKKDGNDKDGGDAGPQEPSDEDLDKALDEAEEDRNKPLLDRAEAKQVAPRMVFIREYAHKQPAGKPFGQRSDFTETVYWSASTKTDKNGLATVSFDLSDSVTSFRVKADAFTESGALGAGTDLIESVRPFYVEPKLPLELTAGDKVLLPIALINNTNKKLPVELTLSKLGQAGKTTLDPISLEADTRGRSVYEMVIGEAYGDLAFTVFAKAGNLMDENKRKLRVVPRGFPIDDGSGGMLNPGGEAEQTITIPKTVVPGSLSASVTVYPTPLASLTEALEALIREPYGCFEQTSSSTFPLVMAQQYFLSHQGIDPALIAKSRAMLDKGYKRLIGFETKEKGYEWFGSTPPHEALTAYGLLEFVEMSKVMDVDQKMIERTADWLMSRMDDKGSFKLDKKALDSFGRAPQDTTNAYIVWSMLEAGYDPEKIAKSIDLVLKKATEGNDAYIVALGANIAGLAADRYQTLALIRASGSGLAEKAAAEKSEAYKLTASVLRKKLADKLGKEGFVEGATTSITRSGGDALKIETTSLAILAWLRDDTYTAQVEKSIMWLSERCKAGRFGSTQSTVLALKAIVEYDKARSTPKAPGSLTLIVDGKPVGEPVKFDEQTKGAIDLPAFGKLLTPGEHTIAVKMADGSKMPYAIAVNYYAEKPASSDACKLRISTLLPELDQELSEGESIEVMVRVSNITKDGLPTPIAIVGIPGGLEPSYDQLKELVKAGTIAAFEVKGRDVVLYWREMKPEQKVELPIRCTAAVPGTYTGPASRAYLYYTDEHKQWADGLKVNITPRKQ